MNNYQKEVIYDKGVSLGSTNLAELVKEGWSPSLVDSEIV